VRKLNRRWTQIVADKELTANGREWTRMTSNISDEKDEWTSKVSPDSGSGVCKVCASLSALSCFISRQLVSIRGFYLRTSAVEPFVLVHSRCFWFKATVQTA
jgi:hypothetical protein